MVFLENETHGIPCDLEIQRAHLIPTIKLDLVIICIIKKKDNNKNDELCYLRRLQREKNRKDLRVPEPCQRTKKALAFEGDSATNYNWSPKAW